MNLKSKYKITAAVFILLFTMGTTLAYFSEKQSIQNPFSTLTPEMQINEKFNKEDRWLPGEEKQKEVKFKNSGQSAALVRFMLETDVKDSAVKKEDLVLWAAENFPDFWSPGGERQESGRVTLKPGIWYYYTRVADPGDTTEITLQSVSFSKKLSNDEGHDADVSGKEINVSVKAEMIQVNEEAALALFGKKYTLLENDQVHWESEK